MTDKQLTIVYRALMKGLMSPMDVALLLAEKDIPVEKFKKVADKQGFKDVLLAAAIAFCIGVALIIIVAAVA